MGKSPFPRSHLFWKLGKQTQNCRLPKFVCCVGTSTIAPTTRRASRVRGERPKSRKHQTKRDNRLITQETLTKTQPAKAAAKAPSIEPWQWKGPVSFMEKGICPVKCSLCRKDLFLKWAESLVAKWRDSNGFRAFLTHRVEILFYDISPPNTHTKVW